MGWLHHWIRVCAWGPRQEGRQDNAEEIRARLKAGGSFFTRRSSFWTEGQAGGVLISLRIRQIYRVGGSAQA